ncbi:hypothetical protein [Collinsella bouchesdurhonensis]|uniref:hypothetical protein n=1 Tax=Collinsella bouchesdurhonensis TaxID=1907654 RepID=UPI00058BB990|nr:hypothetical protein [Collinsella bouchesdurhonensis]
MAVNLKAVNLETVKDTVDLAAKVLVAAADVIEGAKQLGVDVDAVGGVVKDAADGAANGARAVVDGIGCFRQDRSFMGGTQNFQAWHCKFSCSARHAA